MDPKDEDEPLLKSEGFERGIAIVGAGDSEVYQTVAGVYIHHEIADFEHFV
jgi:hypothetical protein